MKKICALALVALLTLGMLAACGGGASSGAAPEQTGSSQPAASGSTAQPAATGEKTKVTVWHLWAEDSFDTAHHQRLVAWADKFNAEHEDIEVEVSGAKTADVIYTTVAAGGTPDIFMNYWNNAPSWSANGALYDLTEYVNNDADFNKDDFMPNAWDLATYQDTIFSIPNTFSSTFLFYREDMLREAGWEEFPKTMEELAQCIDDLTIQEADGTITQMGMIPDFPWIDVVLTGTTYGAPFIDEATNTVTFDDARMQASIQFQADIYEKYGYDNIKRFQETLGARSSAEDPILTGKLAMRWNSENLVAPLEEFGPDVEWNVIGFPAPADQPNLNAGMFTGNVWCMNAKTANPDAAWTVLSSLTSAENMKEMAKGEYDNGMFYARSSAISALRDEHDVNDKTKAIADMMLDKDLVAFPMVAYVNEYLAACSREMEEAFIGEKTVEEATAAVVEEIQPLADKDPV